MTDVVIGTGPSGYATVSALLSRGRRPVVVDFGERRETHFEDLRRSLAENGDSPSAVRIERLKAAQSRLPGGIGRYGSAFAVRPMEDVIAGGQRDVLLRSSHAWGGLSDVWGSAVLPWRAEDMPGWPTLTSDLAPHYEAVSRIMPIAGMPGPLDDVFGQKELAFEQPLPVSPQAGWLISRLALIERRSVDGDVWAAPARQAVAAGCRSCGLCLDGCPYGLIFSTAPAMDALRWEGRIDYVKAEVVGLTESGDGVKVLLGDGREPLEASRVFIAAGVLETVRIVFASRPELAEKGVTMKESRHFFTPILHVGRAQRPDRTPHHTLVQAFLECRIPDISPWLIHTQFYGWNDVYARDMRQRYGFGLGLLDPVFRWLSYRLFAAQSFLHSDHCHRIRLRPAGDAKRRLLAELMPEPGFDDVVGRTHSFLSKTLRAAGLFAVGSASRLDPPGASFHIGSTFPMSRAPKGNETDDLGRLSGSSRIHIVDASIMPAIPASTITFSVMANAHRIACCA
jgi:choline dehydrogenase-like flavoprotein